MMNEKVTKLAEPETLNPKRKLAEGGVLQVITEDSDMLAYGCPRVLFKMDRNGEGQEICMGDLPQCRAPSFAGFTPDMFLEVGIKGLGVGI